ncbi:MAG: 2Fe-2S iron-sulfur cluster binding domain-containing protein [Hydrogenophilales bacterium]|nr:2Fe-2S iron-sulfur cluster binding domain-containing protein [Hydrogenophilales bacterium]
MSHLLPLSRVARLVGESRSALQRMIKQGEIATFDGKVDMEELLRVFPDIQWEDDGEYKRVEEIKRKAFGKRIMERVLPDKEVLAERLFELGKEFASAKSLLLYHDQVFGWLGSKLDDFSDCGEDAAQKVADLKKWLRQTLSELPSEAERSQALLAQESVMRVMSAQVTVRPSGHEFFVEGNDTVLEAALKAGIPLNYGCSNGNCGDCKVRLLSGQVKKVHPHDYTLKETEKANGTFLMCSYTAITDLEIEASVAGAADIPHQEIQAKVKWVEPINEQMMALHLTTPRSQRLRFLAGQYLTLEAGGASGEYYVASCPCDDRQLTLHIRRNNRPFARKVFDDLRKEDTVGVSGPAGNFVFNLDSRAPVIFVAWEDAFAPLKSLIQHAMSLEISENMYLYWIADQTGHYRDNLCRSWADAYDNFFYAPLSAREDVEINVSRILANYADLSEYEIYVAGPAMLLEALKKEACARGLPASRWHAELIV